MIAELPMPYPSFRARHAMAATWTYGVAAVDDDVTFIWGESMKYRM